MSEMIERVAGAIVENNMRLSWEEARDLARAAIKAMRDPTDEMKAAADVSVSGEFYPPDMTWELMIDAALK